MPGMCRFNNSWLTNPSFENWVEKNASDPRTAKCRACSKIIDIANMGEAALKSHSTSKKHVQNCKLMNSAQNNTLSGFMSNLASPSPKVMPKPPPTLTSYTSSNDVLKAEILWTLRTVNTHSSFNSNEEISRVFSLMFPDSAIAHKFTCGEDKTSYIAIHGLAPYFASTLKDSIRKCDGYVLQFDESLNKQLRQKQCDIHVRFWEQGAERVQTRFLTSEFLGHATAEDLFGKLCPIIQDLGTRNLLQISMDGPNVNWKTFDMLNAEINRSHPGKSLLPTGSCSLHIIHNAFRHGCTATEWNLEETLSNLYYFFKDSPARIEDYQKASGIKDLPPKFCKHRWLENISVVEKVISLLPYLATYFDSFKKHPKLKSFESLKEVVKSCLFIPQAQFFLSVAREFEPFLQEFQGDAPLLPFLAEDIFKMIRGLMKRFVAQDHLDCITEASKLIKFDLTNCKHLKDPAMIEIGFVTKTVIADLKKSGKLTDKDILVFRLDCRKFLQAAVTKLLTKSPVTFALVRNMTCLNPEMMMKDIKTSIQSFHSLVKILVNNGRIDPNQCDALAKSYKAFLENCLKSEDSVKFAQFSRQKDRLDLFFHSLMASKKEYAVLWPVVKHLLTLSHGQADVERGFSINKEAIRDNQKQLSLISRRIIIDSIRSVGGIENVNISKEMLNYASNARHTYRLYLDEEKKKREECERSRKRKADPELGDMLNKRIRLMDDIKQLIKLADENAEQAEKDNSLSLLTASNSLRKTAKVKQETLKDLEKEIEAEQKKFASH